VGAAKPLPHELTARQKVSNCSIKGCLAVFPGEWLATRVRTRNTKTFRFGALCAIKAVIAVQK
jgi:hypothetical protein